jgi:choline dehydrogenase-like flavoprotein
MTWDRGSIPDYDAWEALGNTGWNWKSFIAAMLKVENFQDTKEDETLYGSRGVGQGGPIQTLINRYIFSPQEGFIPALESLGIKQNLNSLDGHPLGVMYQPSNIREANYTRSYSPTYLWLAGPNVQVMVNTTVSKVNLQKSKRSVTATGVEVNGSEIKAEKEIILSAGTFLSPQLLELSGIGQKSVLTDAGIDVVLESNGVGENLQDHIRIQSSYILKDNYTSFDELRTNTTYAAQQLALWEAEERSAYDYTGSGYAFMTWSQALGDDSELVALAKQSAESSNAIDQRKLSYLTNASYRKQVPSLESFFSDGYSGAAPPPASGTPLYDARFFTIFSVVMHPFARGSVHINASDPTGKPVIDPKYVSSPYDLRAIIEAAKYNRKIAEAPSLRNSWTEEYDPGLSTTTDAQWEDWVRNNTLSIYHPLGSCSMLPQNKGGVVDSSLKVYGTTNLRIVDASVIPILPAGHLQTMVYGIAERAADIIAKQHR